MSRKPDIPIDTRKLQSAASAPQASAWVSANAGSGKTYVLTMRVIRLLLNGTPPEKILCLTYTKVAAANMATGIFRRLATWTQLDDAALRQEIVDLGEPSPDARQLRRARNLFAEAVETPGGLKIQTIHAFCERLLHLFPFEANVSASFSVIEDEEQALLLQRAQDHVLTHAGDPDLRAAIGFLARETSEDGVAQLMANALRQRQSFEAMLRGAYPLAEIAAQMREAFGLAPSDTAEGLQQRVLDEGLRAGELTAMAAELASVAIGKRLSAAAKAEGLSARFTAYVDIFLKKDQTPFKDLIPEKQVSKFSGAAHRLDQALAYLLEFLDKIRAARLVERSMALLLVVDAVLSRYKHLNAQLSKLDFDDLIVKTQHLLVRPGSEWVLFKLDQGIDHILVDEAQDTSPPQWAVFTALAEEFFAGEGQRKVPRSFFAVGDEKQSIYSFQGAAPQLFARNKAHFRDRLGKANLAFHAINLKLSFRSSPVILNAVDKVFASAENARGLSFEDGPAAPVHEALHLHLPGLVELWPLPVKAVVEDPKDWQLPLDYLSAQDPKLRLAEQIAGMIEQWLAPGSVETVSDKEGSPRPIRAGDILVLVRSRNAFVGALNRALKRRNIPVAGADRLKLNDHMAILDLLALGRAVMLDLDDYSLACALKSPLFGFDDADLLSLAPERKGTLLKALADSDVPRHAQAAAKIRHYQATARALGPFGFYMNVLSAEQGRQKLLARLGPEAGDVLDEFLSAALDHEARGAPSMVRFIAEMEASERPIKRDLDHAGDMVRVMTVHAAKGLEAKIVLLPDTGSVPNGSKDAKFFDLPRGAQAAPLLVWSPRKDEDCKAVAEARQHGLELAFEEHRRLLYVAMTRAEERLYVMGSHVQTAPKEGRPGKCWYDMVSESLRGEMAAHPAPWDETQEVWRLEDGQIRRHVETVAQTAPEVGVPGWLYMPAAVEPALPAPLRPSQILTAGDQPERDSDASHSGLLRGQLVHKLLQYLPDIARDERAARTARFLAREGRKLAPQERTQIAAQVVAVLEHAGLQALFGPSARAEVPLCGDLVLNGRKVSVIGRIDRLLVEASSVLLVDFKSGAQRQSHLGQMGLYAELLRQIYPRHAIKAALIWTEGPEIEWLDEATLAGALAAITLA